MTGHKGNSEFCFPETLNVPRGEAEGNIEVEGKQNSLFPERPVIKCLLSTPAAAGYGELCVWFNQSETGKYFE